jgi:pimeloyl-ACP methyl ester carboxylesterase
MWERAGYIAALPGYRHILFGHRGHGRSQAPAAMPGHHMSRYVDDVVAVLDDDEVGRAVLVAIRWGRGSPTPSPRPIPDGRSA